MTRSLSPVPPWAHHVALCAAVCLAIGCGKKEEAGKGGSCDVTTASAPQTHLCIEYAEYKPAALEEAEKDCVSTLGTAKWVDAGLCAQENRLPGTCAKTGADGGAITIYFYPDFDATSAQAGCTGKFQGTWTP